MPLLLNVVSAPLRRLRKLLRSHFVGPLKRHKIRFEKRRLRRKNHVAWHKKLRKRWHAIEQRAQLKRYRRVVLIDGGAHSGQLFADCLDEKLRVKVNKVKGSEARGLPYFVPKNLRRATIHLFEPNPRHLASLEAMKTRYPKTDIRVHQRLLWTQDGTETFFLSDGKWGDQGSTMIAEKSDYREILLTDQPLQIPAIDTADFILQHTEPSDYVILKLDVEGAEFDIIPHLLSSAALDRIRELHIEWHDWCMQDKRALKQQLKEQLAQKDLYLVDWF